MSELPLKIIGASEGTFILNDTTEFTGEFDGFVVLEDTVVDSIEIDGDDVTSEYISDPSTPIRIGAIVRPKNPTGQATVTRFTSLKLTSGSVAVIL